MDGEMEGCSALERQGLRGQALWEGRRGSRRDIWDMPEDLSPLKRWSVLSPSQNCERTHEGMSKMGINLLEKVYYICKYTFMYHIQK